jgi:imidazolonepropionase-like amidohydrolase
MSSRILIKNVRIFDGVNEDLDDPTSVMTENNLIKEISPGTKDTKNVKVIDGGGRLLMPGLTDAHWHVMFTAMTMQQLENEPLDYVHAKMIREAGATLMRGFTTVRDLGGDVFGIKQAIDEGVVPGPRILPSGPVISQTAGHGDFSRSYDRPAIFGGRPSRLEEIGASIVADGVDQVLSAVRFNLKAGASQIKITGGGGVISETDPIDSTQYTDDEIKAAVNAAADWGTYVAAHVYHPEGILRVLEAGVKSIEHGHLMDEESAKRIAEKDAWLCIQPFFDDDVCFQYLDEKRAEKAKILVSGFDRTMQLAAKYQLNLAFGTDVVCAPENNVWQLELLELFSSYLTNFEILRMTTSVNAKLFELSGKRHPYQAGPLGVIKPGAYADLLIVEGDPLQDLKVLVDYENNLKLIMKDGRVFKNTLP